MEEIMQDMLVKFCDLSESSGLKKSCTGYGYAIIVGVGPADFYNKTVGASIISGSDPGIYTSDLK